MGRLSETLSKQVIRIDRLLKLCWFGELGSLGIYIFMAYIFKHTEAQSQKPELIFIFIFSLIGIMFMALSLWLRYILLSPRAVAGYLEGKGPLWIYKLVHSSFSTGKMSPEFDDTENKMLDYAVKSQTLQIMLWAMLNSTAVFGLVLSILLLRPSIAVAFAIPVFVVVLMQYPDTTALLEAGLREKDLQN